MYSEEYGKHEYWSSWGVEIEILCLFQLAKGSKIFSPPILLMFLLQPF